MCKIMKEFIFEAEETSRGWSYKQVVSNLDRLEAEKIIEKACRNAVPRLQKLINKRENIAKYNKKLRRRGK